MNNLIKSSVSSAEHVDFNKQVQEDLAKVNALTVSPHDQNPVPLLGALPDASKASRDNLRPILTEMVRIDQSKGFACKRIQYSKNGEKMDPPVWWPEDIKFEGISSVMTVDDIRAAYDAAKLHFETLRETDVNDSSLQTAVSNRASTATDSAMFMPVTSPATRPATPPHSSAASPSAGPATPSPTSSLVQVEVHVPPAQIPTSPFINFLARSRIQESNADENTTDKLRTKTCQKLMTRLKRQADTQTSNMAIPARTGQEKRGASNTPSIAERKQKRTRKVSKYSK